MNYVKCTLNVILDSKKITQGFRVTDRIAKEQLQYVLRDVV